MQRTLGRALLLLAFLAGSHQAEAQISLKNNLLYDASLTPNIGMEVGLARKWTFDATFGLNPWTFNDNKKWRHCLCSRRRAIGSARSSTATSSVSISWVVSSTLAE